jgi:hypothetical protein
VAGAGAAQHRQHRRSTAPDRPLLRELPLVTAAVLDGILTPTQATVLTRLVGKIDADALVESQPHLIAVAQSLDPAQLGRWVTHQIATHCEPALDADDATGPRQAVPHPPREADGSLFGRFRLTAEGQRDAADRPRTAGPPSRRGRPAHRRQRRADALVDLSEQVLRHGTLPTPVAYGRS